LQRDAMATLNRADAFIERLDGERQQMLSAVLNRFIANTLGGKLAVGYEFAAYHAYKAAGAPAVCHAMHRKNGIFPPAFSNVLEPPPLRRSSVSNSSKREEKTDSDESLDTLT
jgi:hypothetical protein